MVETQTGNAVTTIILTPNRSMSWRTNKNFLWLMTLWSGAIGVVFFMMGAWPITPFIGLELLGLTAALYFVSWKLSHQEVITVAENQLILEKGIRWPKQTWSWPREQVRVRVETAKHALQTPAILLDDNEAKAVRVGEFLNMDDCEILIKKLTASGLTVRRHGPAQDIPF